MCFFNGAFYRFRIENFVRQSLRYLLASNASRGIDWLHDWTTPVKWLRMSYGFLPKSQLQLQVYAKSDEKLKCITIQYTALFSPCRWLNTIHWTAFSPSWSLNTIHCIVQSLPVIENKTVDWTVLTPCPWLSAFTTWHQAFDKSHHWGHCHKALIKC